MDDFISDYPKAFHKVAEAMGTLPGYLEEHEEFTKESVATLPGTAFAAPLQRKFPIHEKAATLMSAIYYYGHTQPDTKIETRLIKAAHDHGITEDLAKVKETLTGMRKEASAQIYSGYALEVPSPSGGTDLMLPIGNEVQIEESARMLHKIAAEERLPVDMVRTAAQKIVKAAADRNIPDNYIHETCRTLGGERDVDFEKAAHSMGNRARYVSDDDLGLYLDIVKAAAADESKLDDCIRLIVDLDESYGIKYAGAIQDPYSAFYSSKYRRADMEKLASEMIFVSDVMLPKDVVAKISHDEIAARFDKEASAQLSDIVDRASNDPEYASSMIGGLSDDFQGVLLDLALAVE